MAFDNKKIKNIKMNLGPEGETYEKEIFRSQLIERVQDNSLNVNNLILKFLLKTKDEIISSVEMLKR